ncbi:NAD(P)H-binding protein [Psychroserpens sp. Hel_I_66]|uniref:NAD(P)H-binding protein n=1 Tax=Psychroserpens sp. Hel_I_66 TaxID=1250004 RepID=UPI000646918E|nr:NAD(P)H-binding protein [Psychroserpens sp. Hel_I_66]
MNKTAIILGATGLTGSCVLKKLSVDDRYSSIKLFSRSKIKDVYPKVSQYIGDLLNIEQFKDEFTADEVFCCIGTTKAKTPNKELYKKIDCGIPVAAAALAKKNGIHTFLVISALGADASSSTFYTKIKGQMEEGVLDELIEFTYILRPSLIGGDRDEKRTLEKIGLSVLKLVQPLFFGPLRAYKINEAETIANTMIYLANTKEKNAVVVTSQQINTLGKN